MSIRDLGKNIFVYAVGNICLRAGSFILLPLYTRYLSVEDYGLLDLCLTTVQLIGIFMSLGTAQSLIRFYRESAQKQEVGLLYTTSILINFTGGFLFFLFVALLRQPLAALILETGERGKWLLWLAIASMAHSLCDLALSIFRARNQATFYSIAAVLILLSTIGLNLLFIAGLKQGVIGAIYGSLITYSLAFLVFLTYLLRGSRPRFSFALSRRLLSFGFPLVFSMTGWFILNMSSRYFLVHYAGLDDVGIFGLGYRVATVLLIVAVMPFQLAFGPFVFSEEQSANLRDKISRILTYHLLTLLLASWATALVAKHLIHILAPVGFWEAYKATILSLPSIVMIGIYYWAAGLLHLCLKTKIIGLTTAASALINILLNRLLIPIHGWKGAALSMNLSIFAVTAICSFLGVRFAGIALENERLAKISFAFSILFATLFFSSRLAPLWYYLLNGAMLLAALCALLFSPAFKREKEFARDSVRMISSKLAKKK